MPLRGKSSFAIRDPGVDRLDYVVPKETISSHRQAISFSSSARARISHALRSGELNPNKIPWESGFWGHKSPEIGAFSPDRIFLIAGQPARIQH